MYDGWFMDMGADVDVNADVGVYVEVDVDMDVKGGSLMRMCV